MTIVPSILVVRAYASYLETHVVKRFALGQHYEDYWGKDECYRWYDSLDNGQ